MSSALARAEWPVFFFLKLNGQCWAQLYRGMSSVGPNYTESKHPSLALDPTFVVKKKKNTASAAATSDIAGGRVASLHWATTQYRARFASPNSRSPWGSVPDAAVAETLKP